MTLDYKFCLILFIFISVSGCIPRIPNDYDTPGKPKKYKGDWDKYYEWKSSKKKIYPTEKQRLAMLDSFNRIPKNVQVIDKAVDSTVLSSLCYKFIQSPDSSKIIAFYVAPYLSDENKFMRRGGDVVSYHDFEKKDSQILYYGVAVNGMEYKGKWYYERETARVFYGNSLKKAQTDYLFYYLDDEWFFDKWLTSEHSFWYTGGKSISFLPVRRENYLSVYPAFEGDPVLVATGATLPTRLNSEKCKFWIKENIEKIKATDSTYFKKVYFDHFDYYGDVFNKDASKLVVSFINEDTAKNFHLSFFYFQLNNDTIVSINRLSKNTATDSSNGFRNFYIDKQNFYNQFISEMKLSKAIIGDETFWNVSIPKMLGHSFR